MLQDELNASEGAQCGRSSDTRMVAMEAEIHKVCVTTHLLNQLAVKSMVGRIFHRLNTEKLALNQYCVEVEFDD